MNPRPRPRLLAFLLPLLLLPAAARGQDGGGPVIAATYPFPDILLADAQAGSLPAFPIADDRGVLLGGVGSDLWRAPDDPPGEYWMLTDRGPNGQIEVDGENRRTFLVPDFTPHILRVRAQGKALPVVEEVIALVGESGAPVTGLSNREGEDETPYAAAAEEQLAFNPSGLDPEGLVRTADGGFWLAEEYLPSLAKVSPEGVVVKRYVPEGVTLPGADYEVADVLPAIYAARKANRGFEGLALSPDGGTLFAILQSPLSNPDGDTGEASRAGRILAFDIAAETPSAEFVYPFEIGSAFDPDPETTQDNMKLSGAVALDASTLLILERTDLVARLSTVDLGAATDILGSEWDDPATSPSLESFSDPAAAGIVPLPKTLVLDLEALAGMPDKIEGVAVVDASTVAVANDNDFDVGDLDAEGTNAGTGTKSQLLVIEGVPLPAAGTATPEAGTPPAASPAAGTPAAGAAASEIAVVEIADYRYRPRTARIESGTIVRWRNGDGVSHTVTSVDDAFSSGPMYRGGVFSHRFDDPGTYRYDCAYHLDMSGTVVVTE